MTCLGEMPDIFLARPKSSWTEPRGHAQELNDYRSRDDGPRPMVTIDRGCRRLVVDNLCVGFLPALHPGSPHSHVRGRAVLRPWWIPEIAVPRGTAGRAAATGEYGPASRADEL